MVGITEFFHVSRRFQRAFTLAVTLLIVLLLLYTQYPHLDRQKRILFSADDTIGATKNDLNKINKNNIEGFVEIHQNIGTAESSNEDSIKKSTVDINELGLKYIPQASILQLNNAILQKQPDLIYWNKLAYVFYVTEPNRLLPVIINVSQLRKFNTKAQIDIICSFPLDQKNLITKKKIQVLKNYNVKFTPVEQINSKFTEDDATWKASFTKLHAFNMIHYDRIVYMDADAIIKRPMDHLFTLPPAILAAPINYLDFPLSEVPQTTKKNSKYQSISPLQKIKEAEKLYSNNIEQENEFDTECFLKLYSELPSLEAAVKKFKHMKLGSYFMVIQPNANVFQWIQKAIETKKPKEYDMEIVNNIWKLKTILSNNIFELEGAGETNQWLKPAKLPKLLVLPHYPYGLVSGEFRHSLFKHIAYLSSPVDFPVLENIKTNLLMELVKTPTEYTDISDASKQLPDVGYWSWAWRFKNEASNDQEDKTMTKPSQSETFGWESSRMYNDAYYIHWSDWPLPKPWNLNNVENSLNSKLNRMANNALKTCNNEMKDMFKKFNLESEDQLTIGLNECEQSQYYWKQMYIDYHTLLDESKEKIKNVDIEK